MTKKFFKLEQEIASLRDQIAKNEARSVEAKQRTKEAEEAIQKHSSDLEKLLVDKNEKKAAVVEKEIQLHENVLARDTSLIAGLKKQLDELRKRLQETVVARNEVFEKLAVTWLENEKAAYDAVAKNVIEKIKRLLCAYELLRDIEKPSVYRNSIGPAFEFLPRAAIPVLKSFGKTEFYNNKRFFLNRTMIEQVQNEIVKAETRPQQQVQDKL